MTEKLKNYAELAVNVGVGLKPGQTLIVNAPLEAASLVRLVAESAYQAGARLVDMNFDDDALTLIRYEHAPRGSFAAFPYWRTEGLAKALKAEDMAFLSVHATDPDLLKDQDPELIGTAQKSAQTHNRPLTEKISGMAVNWAVVAAPISAWAAKVFPEAAPETRMEKLWEALFKMLRADQADPVAAWRAHLETLREKTDYLNTKHYAALRYRGPDTELTVGLPENHRWLGGQATSQRGYAFVPNMPTEEVFTAPHKDKVEGTVTSSRPLAYAGQLIQDFSFKFSRGRVIEVWAKEGKEALEQLLATDEGARHLGEVALVPNSSPVSRTGLLFYNTLFDENAASHLALGKAYPSTLENGEAMNEQDFVAAGGNDSLTHMDFMVGSADLDIDGVTRDGPTEPLMRAGEWAF
jgi:aminopeptidase